MMISFGLILAMTAVFFYSLAALFKGIKLGLIVCLISIVGIFLILFDEYTMVIANTLGIGRGTDLLLYISVMLAVFILLRWHHNFNHQKSVFTKLCRRIAIDNAKEPLP